MGDSGKISQFVWDFGQGVVTVLTGEYRNTIDEKGRILIPSRLRQDLGGTTLIVTRAIEPCLWLMLPQDFDVLRRRIMDGPGAMFDRDLRILQRKIIAPAQECEIDRTGRINIPQTLRDSANLKLREESVMLGISNYLELWSVQDYEQFLAASEPEFAEAAQALSRELRESERR